MASIAVSCGNCGGQAALGTANCPACGEVFAVLDYGGFWIRFAAYVIDGVILFLAQIALALFVEPEGVIVAVLVAIGLVYTVGFWITDGATPGKMLTGLQVVSRDGRPIGAGQAFLRYFGYILSGLLLGAGYLMIAFREDKRGLHDLIADTIVVRKS